MINALRAGLFVFWFYGSMTIVGLIGMPFAIAAPRAGIVVARIWSQVSLFGLRWICGVRIRIEGREHIPADAAIVACKHQAQLDTILPFTLLKAPAFVLKRELLDMPVFGFFAGRSGHIPLDREAHAAALKNLMRNARRARDDKRQIVIFPEGTRQEPGAPPDYKVGVAAIYRDLGIPCVPVALDTGKVWPAWGYGIKPGVTTIRFLPPIPPGLSRDAFMARLQSDIETASDALWRGAPP